MSNSVTPSGRTASRIAFSVAPSAPDRVHPIGARHGRGLALRVIAEGVEKEEQLTFLRELQCDEYQGFLFSQALPATQVERDYMTAV